MVFQNRAVNEMAKGIGTSSPYIKKICSNEKITKSTIGYKKLEVLSEILEEENPMRIFSLKIQGELFSGGYNYSVELN